MKRREACLANVKFGQVLVWEQVGRDSLVLVIPASDGALCARGNTTKAPVQGSQIHVDATCTVSSPAGHPATDTGDVLVGLLISTVLEVQQQQKSLHMRIMVRELRQAWILELRISHKYQCSDIGDKFSQRITSTVLVQDGEHSVYDVTAHLGPSSGNALLSMRAGQTVAATGLSAREPGQSAQEDLEASAHQASFSCVWAEVKSWCPRYEPIAAAVVTCSISTD